MSALINELNLVAVALGLPKSLKWADTVKVVRKTGDGDSGKTGEGGKTVWTIASLDMPKLADKGKEYQAKAEELLASKAEFTTGKELARAIGFDVDKPTEGQISWPDRMSKFGIIAKKHELAA